MSIVDVIQVGGLDLCHYRREERSRDKSRRWRWAVAGPRKIQSGVLPSSGHRPWCCCVVSNLASCCCCCSGDLVIDAHTPTTVVRKSRRGIQCMFMPQDGPFLQASPWAATGFRIPSLHISAAVSQHAECIKDRQSKSHRQEIRHDSIRRPSRSVGVHGVLARRPAVSVASCSPEKWL